MMHPNLTELLLPITCESRCLDSHLALSLIDTGQLHTVRLDGGPQNGTLLDLGKHSCHYCHALEYGVVVLIYPIHRCGLSHIYVPNAGCLML